MVPASFDEANLVLMPPPDMTADDCEPLNVLRCELEGVAVVVSCWKLTGAEVQELLATGRLWLVVCGMTMPPVKLTSSKPFAVEDL